MIIVKVDGVPSYPTWQVRYTAREYFAHLNGHHRHTSNLSIIVCAKDLVEVVEKMVGYCERKNQVDLVILGVNKNRREVHAIVPGMGFIAEWSSGPKGARKNHELRAVAQDFASMLELVKLQMTQEDCQLNNISYIGEHYV